MWPLAGQAAASPHRHSLPNRNDTEHSQPSRRPPVRSGPASLPPTVGCGATHWSRRPERGRWPADHGQTAVAVPRPSTRLVYTGPRHESRAGTTRCRRLGSNELAVPRSARDEQPRWAVELRHVPSCPESAPAHGPPASISARRRSRPANACLRPLRQNSTRRPSCTERGPPI